MKGVVKGVGMMSEGVGGDERGLEGGLPGSYEV